MRLRHGILLLFLIIILSPVRVYAQDQVSVHTSGDGHDWGFPHREGVVLVLSGGGTKGFSHVGVIEVLERENIPIAAIVGTSMGGIVGGLYASGYSTSELRQILEESDMMGMMSGREASSPIANPGFNMPPVSGNAPLTLYSNSEFNLMGRMGLLKAKELYSFLSDLTARISVINFDQLPIPFAAIATDLKDGDTVILREGNLAAALRATMSIPILFDPWEIDGMILVDGGLKANLPVLEAKKLFPGHPIIAVNLSPGDISRPKERLNRIVEVAAQTLEILMVEQVRANVAAADLVIAPNVNEFGVLDVGGYDKIINRGIEAAEEKTEEIRALMAEHRAIAADHSTGAVRARDLTVAEIHFTGVTGSIAEELYERIDNWVGRPLDMKKVAEAVRQLSASEEFLKVDSFTRYISDDKVAVIFNIERPQKYEVNVNGFASNIYPDSWLSFAFMARDMFNDGDVTSLEYRFSKNWGAMLRYFSPLDGRDSQYGITFSARREEYDPLGLQSYDLERYSVKAAFYKNYGRGTRLGIGYAAERAKHSGGNDVESGPYISFIYNNLDDPIIPSKGLAAATELWYPLGEQLISKSAFQTYIPLWGAQRAIFSGGLKTGDGDKPAYAAMLGSQAELYSLSKHPLTGDQAWWLHLGTSSTIMKTWWGGVSVEVFGNYGQVMRNWTNSGSWWEVGLGFNVSTNVIPGKFIIVYDQAGEFTLGYSIGVPNFWNGPLP